MGNEPIKITIKEAVTNLEKARKSTIVSYVGAETSLIGPEDSPALVDTIEMVLPETGRIEKLDLFLNSPGGFIESAYKIVRICKEYSQQFNVIVPFAAKSAATVICLGANEIVMTSLAELGPIDPIIQHPYKPEIRVPARAIKDFFAFLSATETGDKIKLDPTFKSQMAAVLDPYLIGSYQTALQSSKQIAELLLSQGPLKDNPTKLTEAVHSLTEQYYSHRFAIDRQMARDLGLNVLTAESDKSLSRAIRQLFNIYQMFMRENNIIKVIGNREVNRNFQLAPPIPTPPSIPSSSVNFNF
jgi:hypothetical protein